MIRHTCEGWDLPLRPPRAPQAVTAARIYQGGGKQSQRPKTGAGVGFTAWCLWIEQRQNAVLSSSLQFFITLSPSVVTMLWASSLSLRWLLVGDLTSEELMLLSGCALKATCRIWKTIFKVIDNFLTKILRDSEKGWIYCGSLAGSDATQTFCFEVSASL